MDGAAAGSRPFPAAWRVLLVCTEGGGAGSAEVETRVFTFALPSKSAGEDKRVGARMCVCNMMKLFPFFESKSDNSEDLIFSPACDERHGCA